MHASACNCDSCWAYSLSLAVFGIAPTKPFTAHRAVAVGLALLALAVLVACVLSLFGVRL